MFTLHGHALANYENSDTLLMHGFEISVYIQVMLLTSVFRCKVIMVPIGCSVLKKVCTCL